MGENTKISWADHTFNAWWGCTKVGRGCKHCYAEAFSKRTGRAKWGPEGTRVRTSPKNWEEPIKWNQAARTAQRAAKVFAFSMADFAEDWSGPMLAHDGTDTGFTMDDVRYLFLQNIVKTTPWLQWLILTKRPERLRECLRNQRYPNVMLGCSVTDQGDADKNVPALVACRDLCAGLFVSNEPAIERIHWEPLLTNHRIDALIVGGESGHGREEMDLRCVGNAMDVCQRNGISLWVKQDSAPTEGQQGRIPSFLWNRKSWPGYRPAEASCPAT